MRVLIKFSSLAVVLLLVFFACETQLPVDSQNDQPNLLTEGETVIEEVTPPNCITVPAEAIISSVTLNLFVEKISGETVNIYRATQDWNELTVTWDNFMSAYDAGTVWASFAVTASGWVSVDITNIFMAWDNGTFENFGMVLDQADFTATSRFFSKEQPGYEPFMTVNYTMNGSNVSESITPSDDSYIIELYPYNTVNYGLETTIRTGYTTDIEKQALIKFCIVRVPDDGGEGCTPGYWRNHFDSWPATGYSTTDDFDATFGVDYFNPDITLGEAIWMGGGGVKVIARHGTAALLSAAHPDVNYPYTVEEVIAMVQAGDADPLVIANELGCPLD